MFNANQYFLFKKFHNDYISQCLFKAPTMKYIKYISQSIYQLKPLYVFISIATKCASKSGISGDLSEYN